MIPSTTPSRRWAAHRSIGPKPFAQNGSIAAIIFSLGTGGDEFEPALESAYDDCRLYAAEMAARDYAQRAAEQDEARLDLTARAAIEKMRSHQQMMIDGGFLKSGHEGGKFWMLERSIDGRPILLVSSKMDREVKDPFIGTATTFASAMGCAITTGSYAQDKKGGRIQFTVQTGQAQTPAFVAALNAMGAKKRLVRAAPP